MGKEKENLVKFVEWKKKKPILLKIKEERFR